VVEDEPLPLAAARLEARSELHGLIRPPYSVPLVVSQELNAEAAASEGGPRGWLYGERRGGGGGLALWSFGWRGAGGERSWS
jgi:hypothetical protein